MAPLRWADGVPTLSSLFARFAWTPPATRLVARRLGRERFAHASHHDEAMAQKGRPGGVRYGDGGQGAASTIGAMNAVAAPSFLVHSHGGPDAQGVPVHDFSTNANACGPCPAALGAVRAADAGRYPDPAYTALRARLAAFHGVGGERIVLAGSASEFIFRISAWAARAGRRSAWVPRHAYGDYAQAADAWGLAHAAAPGDAGLAWACVPASPTGAAEPDLPAWAGADAAVRVLDCAYAPLRLSGTPPSTAACDGAWQLHTPNKALGLTGVRGAYAIAPAGHGAMVAALQALCPSWPVGAHGVALLNAWCDAGVQAWLAESLATLRGWKARQLALVAGLGWQLLPGDANFFCAKVPAGDLSGWLAALRTRGIKLRDCASFGLPGHVRLGVLPPSAQDALAAAIGAITASR